MDIVSGDEGDVPMDVPTPAPRPRRRRRRNCALFGAMAYFVFVVSNHPPALFRNIACDDPMRNLFLDAVADGPKVFGVAAVRWELLHLPFAPPNDDVRTLLSKYPSFAVGSCVDTALGVSLTAHGSRMAGHVSPQMVRPRPLPPIRTRWVFICYLFLMWYTVSFFFDRCSSSSASDFEYRPNRPPDCVSTHARVC